MAAIFVRLFPKHSALAFGKLPWLLGTACSAAVKAELLQGLFTH